jgi:hypothetical protein
MARKRPQRARPKATLASLRRRMAKELGTYGVALGLVTGVEGALGFSRLVNVSIMAVSMFFVFLFRRRTTSLILARLYSESAFYPYLYSVVFATIVLMTGYFTFSIGKNLGYTSGVRSTLTSLNLPVRPLPPPRPRFAGDLNLDEFCRAEGPYTPFGPDTFAITTRFPDGTEMTTPGITEELKREYEKHLGTRNFLICSSRVRHFIPSEGEHDYITFPVDEACEWQYPGQQVRAVGPQDRNELDKWRCHLVSGPPATWP